MPQTQLSSKSEERCVRDLLLRILLGLTDGDLLSWRRDGI
jgi:hypothetical protein